MANRHFGKLADVWKHLVLAEVLAVDRPRQVCDTHAGHALYAMTADAERRYGVLGFMDVAAGHDVLNGSAYFRLLAGQRDSGTELSEYPAGPMLAMLELGAESKYLFCDVDPESCTNIRQAAARLGPVVRIVEGDGMAAVHDALASGHGAEETVVYTDPFDHYAVGPSGMSALDLAQEATERGASVVYWYGYDRADQRQCIFDVLRTRAPMTRWWCGDVMVCAPDADMHNGDLGEATSPGTGFGLVCANVSRDALRRCDDFGRALCDAYRGRLLPDGRPGYLDFVTASR